jgi:hypothetical protein
MNNVNSQYLKIGDCVMLYAEDCLGYMTAIGYPLPPLTAV